MVIQLIEGEIFVEKAREVLKDFIHTRESVERLLFPLKIKYGSRFASSKWSELFSLTTEMEVRHFIFFPRRQNGVKYINKDVCVS